MARNKEILHRFAYLLSYPQERYREVARALEKAFETGGEEKNSLQPFVEYVTATRLETVEEKFTRTFDLNKTTCLEIGWHLYGEDYKRGEFLVNMRQSLAEYHIVESIELPDHISHCLKLLAALDADDTGIYVANFLLPAIKTILKNFEKKNPFLPLVETLRGYLTECFVPREREQFITPLQGF